MKRHQMHRQFGWVAVIAVGMSVLGAVAAVGVATGQEDALRSTTYKTAAGHWVSAYCEPSGKFALKRDFIIHARRWNLSAPIYADPDCRVKLFTVHVGGTYRLLGTSPKAKGARIGRFSIGFRQVTPFGAGIASAMTKARCGGTTSKVGVATNILATGRKPLGQQSQKACPVEFDLLKRSGNSLFFGERPADQRGLCSAERQATTLTPELELD